MQTGEMIKLSRKKMKYVVQYWQWKIRLRKISLTLKHVLPPQFWQPKVVRSPILCLDFILFLYLNTPLSFFDENDCNLCESKYYDRLWKVYFCGEQPKSNVDEGYVTFIFIFGIPFLRIVFVFMQHSPDSHINFPYVSQPTNFI